MKFAVFALLVASVSAQICECDEGLTGASCDQCAWYLTRYGSTANASAAQICVVDWEEYETYENILTYAAYIAPKENVNFFSEQEVLCYSNGDFIVDDDDIMDSWCNCSSFLTDPGTGERIEQFTKDSFCRDCADGVLNWPYCNVLDCNTGLGCGINAQCDDSLDVQNVCGDDPHADGLTIGTPYNPTTENCCKFTNIQGDQTGFSVLKTSNQVCCGDTTCNHQENCISADTKAQRPFYPGRDDPAYPGDEWTTVKEFECISKGETECPQPVYNSDIGWYQSLSSGTSCQPYETCCNGDCCSSTEECMVPLGSGYTINYGGGSGTGEQYEWKLADGSVMPEEYRTECISTAAMSAPSAVYIVVLPLTLLIVSIISIAIVIMTAGMGSIKVFIPAIICIFLAIFLFFSQLWTFGLLTIIGSLTAIGAQAATSESKYLVSSIFQFFILAVLVGGFGMGTLLVSSPSVLSSANGSNSYGWSVLGGCASRYGYFSASNTPWDQESSTTGYCSHTWQSALLLVSALIVGFFFLQMVASASLIASADK